MIKNIIFDIGNVILKFNKEKIVYKFTEDEEERKFLLENVFNQPEWTINGYIDTGCIKLEDAIELTKDRTNHINDELIEKFCNSYCNYSEIEYKLLDIIKELKKDYKIYLLSNTNIPTHNYLKESNLFELVDGYVLSYQVHQMKPYEGIYKTLINKYSLNTEESLYIDDNILNINTGNKLGFISKKVEPDNYESIIDVLKGEINYE